MKKCLLLLISAMCFVSCSVDPTAAEEPYLKSFIFRNSIDYDWKQSLIDDFVGEIYLGNIAIEGLDIPHSEDDQPRSFAEAVLILFEDNVDVDGSGDGEGEEELRELWIKSLDHDFNKDWDSWDLAFGEEGSVTKSKRLCRKDPQQAKLLYGRLISAFLQYLQDEADKQIKMISWDYDIMNTGDNYTAYDVVYQLGTGFYVLVNLVEFDNDDRYEFKILNKANSLTEINDYI